MKGRQASDRSPLKTAAGLMTQHRTGPNPLGAVPSLSRAATIAATPPATRDECEYLEHKTALSTSSAMTLLLLQSKPCCYLSFLCNMQAGSPTDTI